MDIIDRCVDAECLFDVQCDDGRFCNGDETCDARQCRIGGTSPCGAGESCDEGNDDCVKWDPKQCLRECRADKYRCLAASRADKHACFDSCFDEREAALEACDGLPWYKRRMCRWAAYRAPFECLWSCQGAYWEAKHACTREFQECRAECGEHCNGDRDPHDYHNKWKNGKKRDRSWWSHRR